MAKPRVRDGETVEPVTFTLPPSYRRAWDDEAAAKDISRSELLRRLTEKVPALAARLENS